MRHRKAISPVIAEVILVAVAIAIAIAVAGWLFGLWGGFGSGSPQIQISTVTVYSNGTVLFYITNQGAGADTLLQIDVIIGDETYRITSFKYENGTTWDGVVPANSGFWAAAETGATFTPGQSAVVKFYFEKSGVVTIPVTISAST